MLVDSGSQITCISEDLSQYLRKNREIMMFPVSKVFVAAAFGRKSTLVKHQMLLDIHVDQIVIPTSFLIVPNLTSGIILGNDWLLRNQVKLDFQNHQMDIGGHEVDPKNIVFGEPVRNTIRKEVKDGIVSLQLIEFSENALILTENIFSVDDDIGSQPQVSNKDGIDVISDNISSVDEIPHTSEMGVCGQVPVLVASVDLTYDRAEGIENDEVFEELSVGHLYLQDEDETFLCDVHEAVHKIKHLTD